MKFCMQVPMTSIITYIKSKKPPRLVCSRQPPRAAAAEFALARNTIEELRTVEGKKLSSLLFMYYSIARAVVAVGMVAKMAISQGCHPRRFFFIFYM